MEEEKLFRPFNRVELLVHPFFALEHMHVKRRGGKLKNTGLKEGFETYMEAGLVEQWLKRIESVMKDPHALFVLIGIKEFEANLSRNAKEFFPRGLTKEKLKRFSEAYRLLLQASKKVLGKRMLYVTSGVYESNLELLMNTLLARGFVPAKDVRVNAYGEYLNEKTLGSCVRMQAHNTRLMLADLQNHAYEGKTRVTVRHLKGKPKKRLSVTPLALYIANLRLELKRSGVLNVEYLKKKRRLQAGLDLKEEATKINAAWERGKNGRNRKRR
jgi:hypothetical protein